MPKVVALVKRLPGQSRAEFLEHWRRDHPAFVAALPGILKYVQSPATEHPSKRWEYDGMAELHFATIKDVAIAFNSPAAERLFSHERQFIGDLTWFIADEHEIELRD